MGFLRFQECGCCGGYHLEGYGEADPVTGLPTDCRDSRYRFSGREVDALEFLREGPEVEVEDLYDYGV